MKTIRQIKHFNLSFFPLKQDRKRKQILEILTFFTTIYYEKVNYQFTVTWKSYNIVQIQPNAEL